jgi:hypothetical protein
LISSPQRRFRKSAIRLADARHNVVGVWITDKVQAPSQRQRSEIRASDATVIGKCFAPVSRLKGVLAEGSIIPRRAEKQLLAGYLDKW